MTRLTFIWLFLIICHHSFGHASVMYISARPITCLNHAYEIEVLQLSDRGSSVIFGGLEIVYGDGAVEDFPDSDFQMYIPDDEQAIIKYVKNHVFQGPGVYTINARFFNRNSDILNMKNSVNTPYYVSTTLTVDPFLGCNTTPTLENLPQGSMNGFTYFHDFSFLDNENDSLSFSLATPMQDRLVEVVEYWPPTDRDSIGQPISRLSLDPFNGSVLLNSKNSDGRYTVALQVHEWRKVDGAYFRMSSSTLDFEMDVYDAYIDNPNNGAAKDTAILAGQSYLVSKSFTDPEQDSIQVNVYGDFVQLCDPQHEADYAYYPGPVHKEIGFTSKLEHVRKKPYKLIFSAKDKSHENVRSFNYSQSTYIWVTEKECMPLPPKNFMAQPISPNQINLYWNDSKDELGYILERASEHFPEFVRLAVLPANFTFFNDSSVVDNVRYQYRIKAVGTTMSELRYEEVTTPDIVTSIARAIEFTSTNVYPNPSDGQFVVTVDFNPDKMEIIDIDGRCIWSKMYDATTSRIGEYKMNQHFNSGVYFLRIFSMEQILIKKIIIN